MLLEKVGKMCKDLCIISYTCMWNLQLSQKKVSIKKEIQDWYIVKFSYNKYCLEIKIISKICLNHKTIVWWATKLTGVTIAWFHWYEVLSQSKLIYSNRKHNWLLFSGTERLYGKVVGNSLQFDGNVEYAGIQTFYKTTNCARKVWKILLYTLFLN